MRQLIFLFSLLFAFLLTSCTKNTQEFSAKVFGGRSITLTEQVQKQLKVGTPIECRIDHFVPRTNVQTRLFTDPCTLTTEILTTSVKDDGLGTNNVDVFKCSELVGPWQATFVKISVHTKGTGDRLVRVPALLRPGNESFTGNKDLIPTNIYLENEYDIPITVLVER